jgi:hypothetical protein
VERQICLRVLLGAPLGESGHLPSRNRLWTLRNARCLGSPLRGDRPPCPMGNQLDLAHGTFIFLPVKARGTLRHNIQLFAPFQSWKGKTPSVNDHVG